MSTTKKCLVSLWNGWVDLIWIWHKCLYFNVIISINKYLLNFFRISLNEWNVWKIMSITNIFKTICDVWCSRLSFILRSWFYESRGDQKYPSEYFQTFLMIFQNLCQVTVVCTRYLARPHTDLWIPLLWLLVSASPRLLGHLFLFYFFLFCFVCLLLQLWPHPSEGFPMCSLIHLTWIKLISSSFIFRNFHRIYLCKTLICLIELKKNYFCCFKPLPLIKVYA